MEFCGVDESGGGGEMLAVADAIGKPRTSIS
jgi:hypothetical protein